MVGANLSFSILSKLRQKDHKFKVGFDSLVKHGLLNKRVNRWLEIQCISRCLSRIFQ